MVLDVYASNPRSVGPTVQPAECKETDSDKQTLPKTLPLPLTWEVKIGIGHHPLLQALDGMRCFLFQCGITMARILSHLYWP